MDRDRDRRSFRYGKEPGEVVLTVEVVSKSSARKDYQDILEIYRRLGVREYLAIRPTGHYSDGPFELTGWQRDPNTGRLELIRPDTEGRLSLRTTGLLAGTGPGGWGLRIWDAATGKRLRPPEEEAEERAERAEQEAAARQQSEQEMASEIAQLRALLQEREGS